MDELTQYMADEATYFMDTFPLMRHSAMGVLDGNAVHYACMNEIVKLCVFENTSAYEYIYNQAKERCRKIYADCMVSPGLINRGHHKAPDQQRQDDYILLAALAAIVGEKQIGQHMLAHGRKHWFIWNNTRDKSLKNILGCFFLRIPGCVQVMKLAADEPLNWWDRFHMGVGFFFSSHEPVNSTSAKMMDFAVIKAFEAKGQNYFFPRWMSKIWKSKLSGMYPDLMGGVFSVFFSPIHLFSKWMAGKM